MFSSVFLEIIYRAIIRREEEVKKQRDNRTKDGRTERRSSVWTGGRRADTVKD